MANGVELASLLERRIKDGEPFPYSFIHEADAYSAPPEVMVSDREHDGGGACVFFTKARWQEVASGTPRRKRDVDGSGGWCWHQEGVRKEVHGAAEGSVVAYNTSFSYMFKTKNPAGSETTRSGWCMVETVLNQQTLAGCDLYVLCKVYKSNRKKHGQASTAANSAGGAEVALVEHGRVDVAADALCRAPPEAAPVGQVAADVWVPTPAPVSVRPALSISPRSMISSSIRLPVPGRITRRVSMCQLKGKAVATAEEKKPTVVMKFGGSSLPSAEGMKVVANHVLSLTNEKPVVVLSAMSDTTGCLIQAAWHARWSGDAQKVCEIPQLNAIKDLHLRTVDELQLDRSIVSGVLDDLEEHLKSVATMKEPTPSAQYFLVSFGELLSTRIFSAYLNKLGTQTQQYDKLDVAFMTTDNKHTDILQATCSAIINQLQGDWIDGPAIPIVAAGLLGKEWESYVVANFERGGCDLIATTIGKALGSKEIQIWKDMDGVLTCDPNISSGAIPLPYPNFDKSAEPTYFGAQTMRPYMEGGIPVGVKGPNNPYEPDTLITKASVMCKSTLTGIVLEPNITVLDIKSTGSLQQNGFVANVFKILEACGISFSYTATYKGSMLVALVPSKLGLDNVVGELQKIAVVRMLQHRSVVSMIGNEQISPFKLAYALAGIGAKLQMILQGLPDCEVMKVSLLVHDSEAESCVGAFSSAFSENGFVPEANGAENDRQIPESSYAAVSSCGIYKRKAGHEHSEAPPSVRPELADEQLNETERMLLRPHDDMAAGASHSVRQAADYAGILNDYKSLQAEQQGLAEAAEGGSLVQADPQGLADAAEGGSRLPIDVVETLPAVESPEEFFGMSTGDGFVGLSTSDRSPGMLDGDGFLDMLDGDGFLGMSTGDEFLDMLGDDYFTDMSISDSSDLTPAFLMTEEPAAFDTWLGDVSLPDFHVND